MTLCLSGAVTKSSFRVVSCCPDAFSNQTFSNITSKFSLTNAANVVIKDVFAITHLVRTFIKRVDLAISSTVRTKILFRRPFRQYQSKTTMISSSIESPDASCAGMTRSDFNDHVDVLFQNVFHFCS